MSATELLHSVAQRGRIMKDVEIRDVDCRPGGISVELEAFITQSGEHVDTLIITARQ
jgi:hypothetical protein